MTLLHVTTWEEQSYKRKQTELKKGFFLARFPVGRIHRLLRKRNYAERVGAGAPVYLAAIMVAVVDRIGYSRNIF